MGTGKSTVARRLGARLGMDVVDTDRVIESEQGRTVREIFAGSGEAAFRHMEEQTLVGALAGGPRVVAAAGGIVVREANRVLLRNESAAGRAVVVWLRAGTDALVQRTSRGAHRPLLDDDPAATLDRLAVERSDLYAEVADAVVDTDGAGIEDVVDAVVAALGGADS